MARGLLGLNVRVGLDEARDHAPRAVRGLRTGKRCRGVRTAQRVRDRLERLHVRVGDLEQGRGAESLAPGAASRQLGSGEPLESDLRRERSPEIAVVVITPR